ncbi:MAG: histidine--tRNA ligase [Desulfomonilaceae bacterium]
MINLVKGFHDILPDQSLKWAYIATKARACLERFGFREIVTPIVEKTQLFQRGIGQTTDIVEKEMYTFIDISGDSLSLRPEATAGILRSVVEHSLLRHESILKVFSIGPMFRRERPSKGRFRQFFQINAEVLGEDSPLVDAEIILAATSILQEVGATDFCVDINSVGCKHCRETYKYELKQFFRPELDRLCSDCQRRFGVNPMRILDCKEAECISICRNAPLIGDWLDTACKDHFDQVKKALDSIGVTYRVEPRLVRGLDYYSRTAFEFVNSSLGRSKAVGGGGRYDSLISELGGPDVSGIGFGLGIERLSMNLPEESPDFRRKIDIFVAVIGDSPRTKCFELVNRLRKGGFSVDVRYSDMSLKAQMKLADRLGAQWVIMVGENELSQGKVTIRNMNTKEQILAELDGIEQVVWGEKS